MSLVRDLNFGGGVNRFEWLDLRDERGRFLEDLEPESNG
jgi:hypothetical protein